MRFEIGAMTVGDILDRGLKVLFARLPTFFAINLIVQIPMLLFQFVQPILERDAPMVALVGMALVFILYFLLSTIGSAAMLHIISQEYIDRRVGMSEGFNLALARLGSLLGGAIMFGLWLVLGYILCCFPMF